MTLRQYDADEFDFHIEGTTCDCLMVVRPNTSDKNSQSY